MARADRACPRRRALVARLLLAPAAVLVAGVAPAQQPAASAALPHIGDLRSIAATMRRDRVPLLLFFSTPGCPYCIEVRRSYLVPRLNDSGLIIREVEIVSPRRFAGVDGKPLTEAELAGRFGVRMVPVVQLVDASLTPIGSPLIGVDASGFYEAYLSTAIEDAQRVMRAR